VVCGLLAADVDRQVQTNVRASGARHYDDEFQRGAQHALAEMMGVPFVMREEGSSTRARLLALCRTYNAPAPRISLQFNGLHEAIQAVVAGYGANFVSSLVVKELVERGELCRVYVQNIHLENTIAICTRKNESLSAPALNLVETIRKNPYG
jgi:DNA-binding transcriptional LysR family regulator